MQDLVVSIRRAEIQEHLDDVNDEELFEQFFPISKPANSEVKPALPLQLNPGPARASAIKRALP